MSAPSARVAVLALAAASACAPASAGAPGRRTVLVELFTSQGCSSCPAAAAFVRELPALGLPRARVVPLTFHVDYWNDLGWADPFSSPAFTARQRRYEEVGRLRGPGGDAAPMTGLYTPQMIVDGAVHFSGRRREVALAELARAAAAAPQVDLDANVGVDGERATVTVRARPRGAFEPREWEAFVALAARAARTHVTRGENGGETLDEAAVVRALSPAARLGPGATTLTVTKPRDLPWSAVELVVVVQSPTTMQVAAVQSLEPREPRKGDAP
jgi:hypothetical protein